MSAVQPSSQGAAPWKVSAAAHAAPVRARRDWGRALPLVGPVALLLIWDLVVRGGWIKPILLPAPIDTLVTLVNGMTSSALLPHFWVTLKRTLLAFMIATALGMPLGILLGSTERAYRSVEFVIDFFRSTPSSALIPLFLLIFGISDVNKVAIAAFGAFLIVIFNCAYGVINARKQRVAAARRTPERSLRKCPDIHIVPYRHGASQSPMVTLSATGESSAHARSRSGLSDRT